LNGVATEWRQRGIRTPSGNFWSPQNLRQMLLSPSIAGYRTHHGNLIEGTWKPIIPRKQWELLKALLEDPARSNGRRGHPAGYLLTGLVVCGVCGHRMVVDYNRRGGGRRVRSYKCKHRPAYGGCGRVSRNAETIENLIVEALFVAVESDDFDRLASNMLTIRLERSVNHWPTTRACWTGWPTRSPRN
jgi:site-specific DNA recombinase